MLMSVSWNKVPMQKLSVFTSHIGVYDLSYITHQLRNVDSWEEHVSKDMLYFNDCGLSLNDLTDNFELEIRLENSETEKGQLVVCSSIMQYVG